MNVEILLISELEHFLVTLGIFFFLFARFRDWRLVFPCFGFGMLIDVDHLFDYFYHYGADFRLWNLFNVDQYVIPNQKVFVLFHGWEFVILAWFLGKFLEKTFKIKGVSWAVFLVYLGHLLMDNFSFSHHPFAYSFIFRALNNFSLASFDGV